MADALYLSCLIPLNPYIKFLSLTLPFRESPFPLILPLASARLGGVGGNEAEKREEKEIFT